MRLTSEPTGEVTVALSLDTAVATVAPAMLTFTALADNWNTPQTVTVTGTDDDFDNDGRSTTITHAVSGADYSGVMADAVAVALTDNDVQGVTISTSSVTVTEAEGTGRTATYTVRLTSEPTGEVTVALSLDTTVATVAPAMLTFTALADNWNTPQTVTVTGTDDGFDNDGRSTNIAHAVSGADYSGVMADAVTVVLADNDGKGVTISTSSVTVTEAEGTGRTATYTVRLTSEPTGEVMVALSLDTTVATVAPAMLTFTALADNWNTPQTVTVTGVDDDVDSDRSATISHAVSGADYINVTAVPVTVALIDDDARGVTISTGSVTVTEAGDDDHSKTYTVRLTSEPTGEVTVALSLDTTVATVAPAMLTFTGLADNWKTPQTVTVTGTDDDFDNDGRSTNIAHAVSGADYSGVMADAVAVVLADNDVQGVTISTSSVTVTEAGGTGRTATYTVELAGRPTGEVTVALSLDTTVATVAPAMLTFTALADNWNTPQTVTVTGTDDDFDNDGRSTTITHAVSGADYSGVMADAVAVALADNDVRGVTISTGSVTVTEAEGTGRTATYTVRLTSEPTGEVTVALSLDATVATVAPARLTFTALADNWKTPQTVTVTGTDDYFDNDDRSTTITHRLDAAGTDYEDVTANPVAVTLTDDDATGVMITAVEPRETAESDGTYIYMVRLTSEPDGEVTVNVMSGNTDVAIVSPNALTFSTTGAGRWDMEQTVIVTVTDVDDMTDNTDNDGLSTTISHTVSGADYTSVTADPVTVVLTDNDGQGIIIGRGVIIAVDDPFTVTEDSGPGHSNTYTVRLTSEPTGEVTVALESSHPAVATVAPAMLTFTGLADNWNTPQTVTVTGMDDDIDNDGRSATISHTVSGADYTSATAEPVTVALIDDDARGVTISTDNVTVTEAGGNDHSKTYTVRLTSEPTDPVMVVLENSHPAVATVAPAMLTFTALADNWKTPQTVTVTGTDDYFDNDGRSTTITHRLDASGTDYEDVTANPVAVTLTDDDATGVTITAAEPREAAENGGAYIYMVQLDSEPTGPVTVTATATVPAPGDAATVVALTATDRPAATTTTLTFTATNWNTAQTVTVTGVDDDIDSDRSATISHTVSGVDYTSVTVEPVTVALIDDDARSVTISTDNVTVTEAEGTGRTAIYTVRLTSEPTDPVTVALESSNLAVAIVSPNALTFNAGDWNSPQTVTVTGVDDDIDSDRSTTITHRLAAAGTDYEDVTANPVAVTLTDDDATGVTITAAEPREAAENGGAYIYMVQLDSEPTNPVTVTATATVPAPGDAATFVALTATDRPAATTTTLTFTATNWNTAQTVTVTGVDDDIDNDGRSATISHTVSGVDYTSATAEPVTVALIDDDARGVTISTGSVTVTEAEGTGRTAIYTVRLTSEPTDPVTVALESSNLAVAIVSPKALTFNAGDWNSPQPVTVTGVDDMTDSDRSTTISHVVSGADYTSVTAEPVIVVLTDNDAPPVRVAFVEPFYTVIEGSNVQVAVRLSANPQREVTIPLTATARQGARFAQDYTLAPDPFSVTFTTANWSTPQTVTISATRDTEDDEGESVQLGFDTLLPEGIIPGTQTTATVTLTDDKTITPTGIILSLDSTTMIETASQTRFILTATATPPGSAFRSTQTMTIVMGAITDSAVAGVDYVHLGDTITIAARDSSGTGTIILTPADDNLAEGDEIITMTGQLVLIPELPVTSIRLTLTDNDLRPTQIGLTLDPTTLTENGGARRMTVTATVAGDSTFDTEQRIAVTVRGSGIPATVGFLPVSDFFMTLPMGASGATGSFTLTPVDDELPGIDETITIAGQMTSTTGVTVNAATVKLIDDDAGVLTEVTGQWLSRLGHTVATDAVSNISERFRDMTRRGTSKLTLGGQAVGPSQTAGQVNHQRLFGWPLTASGAGQETAHAPSARLAGGSTVSSTVDMASWQEAGVQRSSMSIREMMVRSTFELTLGSGDDEASVKPMALWGQASTSRFDSAPVSGLSLDGKVTTGYLGLDYARDNQLIGIAVSHTMADGSYDLRRADTRAGRMEATLTSIYPYATWVPYDGVNLWVLLGQGQGDYVMGEGADQVTTDLDMRFAALGLRGDVHPVGGVDLVLKADVFRIRMDSATLDGLAATQSRVSRLRLAVTASTQWSVSEESQLIPSLELGERWDEGDAGTGLGTELGAGLIWRHPRLALDVTARGRVLLNHERSDLEEWGASLAIERAVGADGRGLALSLAPTWGQPSSGLDTLWNSERGLDFLTGRGDSRPVYTAGEQTSVMPERLEVAVAWGFPRPMGLLTSYTRLRMEYGVLRWIRGGLRLGVSNGLKLEFFVEREFSGGELSAGQQARHGVGINGVMEF